MIGQHCGRAWAFRRCCDQVEVSDEHLVHEGRIPVNRTHQNAFLQKYKVWTSMYKASCASQGELSFQPPLQLCDTTANFCGTKTQKYLQVRASSWEKLSSETDTFLEMGACKGDLESACVLESKVLVSVRPLRCSQSSHLLLTTSGQHSPHASQNPRTRLSMTTILFILAKPRKFRPRCRPVERSRLPLHRMKASSYMWQLASLGPPASVIVQVPTCHPTRDNFVMESFCMREKGNLTKSLFLCNKQRRKHNFWAPCLRNEPCNPKRRFSSDHLHWQVCVGPNEDIARCPSDCLGDNASLLLQHKGQRYSSWWFIFFVQSTLLSTQWNCSKYSVNHWKAKIYPRSIFCEPKTWQQNSKTVHKGPLTVSAKVSHETGVSEAGLVMTFLFTANKQTQHLRPQL